TNLTRLTCASRPGRRAAPMIESWVTYLRRPSCSTALFRVEGAAARLVYCAFCAVPNTRTVLRPKWLIRSTSGGHRVRRHSDQCDSGQGGSDGCASFRCSHARSRRHGSATRRHAIARLWRGIVPGAGTREEQRRCPELVSARG